MVGSAARNRLLSDQEPPVSRWLVRKSDGTELRFPSLDALKSYILSGVVTSGDVVAPEDASWARIEDLAELSALMGMIAPPKSPPDASPSESSEATPLSAEAVEPKPDSIPDDLPAHDKSLSPDDHAAIASSPTTRPPPLPKSEAEQFAEDEGEDEPKTVYSGPPTFDHDPPSLRRDPSAQFAKDNPTLSEALVTPNASQSGEDRANPLSRPLHTTSEREDALLSAPVTHESDEDLLSRPISRSDSSPQTHEVMTLALKRAQRRRIIIGSVVIGMLVAIAIFFAVRNIQQASIPPDQREAEAADQEAQDKTPDAAEAIDVPAQSAKEPSPPDAASEVSDPKPSPEPADKNGTASNASTTKAKAEKLAEADEAKPVAKETEERKTTANKAEAKAAPEKPGGEQNRGAESAAGKATTPTSIDGLLSRAKKVRKKDAKEALRLYKIVLSKNPSHGDAMQLAARAYLQLGRSSDAIELLKTCRSKRPRFSPCLYYLGRSYERAGQGAEAKKAYKTLVDEFPESSLSTKARKKLGQ